MRCRRRKGVARGRLARCLLIAAHTLKGSTMVGWAWVNASAPKGTLDSCPFDLAGKSERRTPTPSGGRPPRSGLNLYLQPSLRI